MMHGINILSSKLAFRCEFWSGHVLNWLDCLSISGRDAPPGE
jgi:hypothetical protein